VHVVRNAACQRAVSSAKCLLIKYLFIKCLFILCLLVTASTVSPIAAASYSAGLLGNRRGDTLELML
jgi:hypothetical protein